MEEIVFKPTRDEMMMTFVASCIEDVADKLGVPYLEIFERMERVRMIDDYIYPCYETLHTESRSNLTESLIDTLSRWENEEQQ